MRFVRMLAATAALAGAGLSGQAQAAQFLHYQLDFTVSYPPMPEYHGVGSLSFERSIHRVRGVNYNITGDNISCWFSAGVCSEISFTGDTNPPLPLNVVSVGLSVSPSLPVYYYSAFVPVGTLSNPGVYYSSNIVGHSTLTITSVDRMITAPVPEPATWALMIVGFGAIGAAIRRNPSAPASGHREGAIVRRIGRRCTP